MTYKTSKKTVLIEAEDIELFYDDEPTTNDSADDSDDCIELICMVDTEKFNHGMENGILNSEVRKAITTGMITFQEFMDASDRTLH